MGHSIFTRRYKFYFTSLRIIERGRWSDIQGNTVDSPDKTDLPSGGGWTWEAEWEILKDEKTDIEGWEYGADFKEVFYPSKQSLDYVRRRKWIRKAVRYGGDLYASTNNTSTNSVRAGRNVY